LLPFADLESIVTVGEGRTTLQQADRLAAELNMKRGSLFLQYEGFNPSGSFKDNGMTAGFTVARMLGRRRVACASTGNTSASMAMFASMAAPAGEPPVQGLVFIGSGKIAYGKLSQALDHGALTLQVDGDFDACMRRVVELSERLGLYLMNSLNPYRLEGQKAIMYRILEGLDWQAPDWIVVPGGNLGNSSAFGKAYLELEQFGLVKRVPRLAIINAAGANTLYEMVNRRGLTWNGGRVDREAIGHRYREMDEKQERAHTVASAIEIGRPVNFTKALRSLDVMDGVVRQVDDETILDFKALVGRFGYSCEPASAASVAGVRLLREEGVISPDDRVACVLTGHGLKDPDATVKYHAGIDAKAATWPEAVPPTGAQANPPIPVPDDLDAICAAVEQPPPPSQRTAWK
jgi:threonine synthase